MNLAQDIDATVLLAMGFTLTEDHRNPTYRHQILEKGRVRIVLNGTEGVVIYCMPEGSKCRGIAADKNGSEWRVKFDPQVPSWRSC